MNIIGLNHGEINSSSALYKDGKIIADGDKESVMKAMFPQQAKVAGVVS